MMGRKLEMDVIDAAAVTLYRIAMVAAGSRRIPRGIARRLTLAALAANRRQGEDAEQALAWMRLRAAVAVEFHVARVQEAAERYSILKTVEERGAS